jgi:hypothetical protein
MSKQKVLFLSSLFSLLVAFGTAYPFHEGGVGPCEGCHTMHGTEGGLSLTAGSWLMRKADPSSICLNCHAGSGGPSSISVASTDGSAMTPGGDFAWLNRDFTWAGGSSPGERHGHNVIAVDFGFPQDFSLSAAPGGTYLAGELGCNSCHDPHGKGGGGTGQGGLPVSGSGSYGGTPFAGTIQGNFRLLGGSGYDGGEQASGFAFIAPSPVARGNPAAPYGETDTSHVDYGSGMSAWCGNCHGGILNSEHSAGTGFEHPTDDTLDAEMIDTYNRYVRTGDISGTAATSYLALVPFERGASDANSLDPTSLQGPDTNSKVMCLTCHRAHASAFRAIGRWDFNAQLLSESHPAAGDAGVSGSDLLHSYYGRDIISEFGPSQGPLCEKCHGGELAAETVEPPVPVSPPQ